MAQFKYQEAIQFFKDEITSGRLSAGDRIPDLEELMKRFDTSKITITRALNDLQQMGFIRRVQGQGSFVCGVPAIEEDSGSPPQHSFISCILPFDLNQNDFIKSVEDACREKNYLFTIRNSHFSSAIERDAIVEARAKGASGIIIYPVSATENIELYSRMAIDHFPFVVIDRSILAFEHPFVSCSNIDSFCSITDYLLGKGHRRIGFLCGDINLSSTYERFQGYCKAILDRSIPIDKDLVVDRFYVQRDKPDEGKIQEILRHYRALRPRVTAIACANDFIASMLLQQADKMGIRVPEELSITGFDNLYFTAFLRPPLTTVIQPFKEIGENAIRLLSEMIATKDIIVKTVRCPASIIERESVATVSVEEDKGTDDAH